MTKFKVVLVDDHRLLREALGQLLDQVAEIQVVGGFGSGEDLINGFSNLEANLILMDIMLPGMTGLEATRWVKERSPNTKVIIVSSEIKKEFVSLGIKCGIDGYLPKDVGKDTLVEAIQKVMGGEKYFNEAITSLVFEDYYHHERTGSTARKVVQGLTKRESEVLEAVASGKTNTEIADTLFISVKTVETHKTNILEKLGLRNSVELVRYAVKHNLINLE